MCALKIQDACMLINLYTVFRSAALNIDVIVQHVTFWCSLVRVPLWPLNFNNSRLMSMASFLYSSYVIREGYSLI